MDQDKINLQNLLEELLKIKNDRELYKFTNKQKQETVIDLIYLLPKKNFKHACFMVFAVCDYNAKINNEKGVLDFINLLAKRALINPKFRKEISATLGFLISKDVDNKKDVSEKPDDNDNIDKEDDKEDEEKELEREEDE